MEASRCSNIDAILHIGGHILACTYTNGRNSLSLRSSQLINISPLNTYIKYIVCVYMFLKNWLGLL